MDEETNQVLDGAETSDEGALSDPTGTQGADAGSSDDGTTAVSEPTVADLQKQIAELQGSQKERESRWAEEYRAIQSDRDKALNRLEPFEREARMAAEEVQKQNEAFHLRADKIGYPAAIAELTQQQQDVIRAQSDKERTVDEARTKFFAAGKLPSDFNAFYNSRTWNSRDAFMSDVELHLKGDHVATVTEKSKAELARQLDEDARRKAANKQPKSGGSPSMSGKSSDPGQAVLDGMANAARRINAATDTL